MPKYLFPYTKIKNCGECPFFTGGIVCPIFFGVKTTRVSRPKDCELEEEK